jgi:hypothetical protein
LEQAAAVETEVVRYRELAKEVRTVGKLDYSEARISVIDKQHLEGQRNE